MLSEEKSYKSNCQWKLEVCLLTFTFSHQRDANERKCCWNSFLVSDKLAKVEWQAFTYHNSTKIYMNILLLFRSFSMTKAFTWKNGLEMKQISENSCRDNFQTDLCCLPFVRDAKTNLAWTLFCPYINTPFPRSSHLLSLSLRASLRPKSFFRVAVFTHIGIKTNYNDKNFVLRGIRK